MHIVGLRTFSFATLEAVKL